MARTPLIAGNWKMHKSASEAARFAAELRSRATCVTDREVAVFPPFTSLPAVAEALRGSAIRWGGQNFHWEASGAYTGEISARFLVDLGCSYVLIGHSERRTLFGETDEGCNRKVHAAVNAGLKPILCCGETLTEREQGQTFAVLERQLVTALTGLEDPKELVIAYEPVWAIGTGRTATPEQAAEVHAWIRSWLGGRFDTRAQAVRIIYGGSVKPDNIDSLMARKELDGVLVGGASLDTDSFMGIVQYRRL